MKSKQMTSRELFIRATDKRSTQKIAKHYLKLVVFQQLVLRSAYFSDICTLILWER